MTPSPRFPASPPPRPALSPELARIRDLEERLAFVLGAVEELRVQLRVAQGRLDTALAAVDTLQKRVLDAGR